MWILPDLCGRILHQDRNYTDEGGAMRVFIAFLCVAVFAVVGESLAQDIGSMSGQMAGDVSPEEGGMGPCVATCGGCRCGSLFGRYCHCCGCCENGNCACQGSYKYPVPPQYTYFWAGIYGQHPMTAYVSPLHILVSIQFPHSGRLHRRSSRALIRATDTDDGYYTASRLAEQFDAFACPTYCLLLSSIMVVCSLQSVQAAKFR